LQVNLVTELPPNEVITYHRKNFGLAARDGDDDDDEVDYSLIETSVKEAQTSDSFTNSTSDPTEKSSTDVQKSPAKGQPKGASHRLRYKVQNDEPVDPLDVSLHSSVN
jgi:hypothetical protein